MGKDPAFLFYFRDFLVSTEFLKPQDIGYYIKILCHMADKGRLNMQHMQSICKAYGFAHPLYCKFKMDENGLFYNERLEEEVVKRCKYTESRRENAKAYAKHMVNANDNNTTIPTKGDLKGEIIPTLGEIRAYAIEINSNVDPVYFFDFYTANGWMKGKNKIKDWKAAFRNAEKWEKLEKGDKHVKRMLN